MSRTIKQFSHRLWDSVKYFVNRKALCGDLKLMVSVGLLIKLYLLPVKTIRNGISNYGKDKSKYWSSFKANSGIYVDYESIPLKSLNKYKMPTDPIKAYELLKAKEQIEQEIHTDLEHRHLQMLFKDSYNNKWPACLRFYREKINNAEKQIHYAKSHALLEEIIKAENAGYPRALIFSLYLSVLIELIDGIDDPKFSTNSRITFWRKILKARRNGIPATLIHQSLGVSKEYLIKITGEIRAFIRLLLRHPKRHLTREIIRRVEKRYGIKLSKSSIKSFKSKNKDRQILEFDSNGNVYSRQNGLPKLTKFLAEGPGEQYQGDFYRHQFWCRSNSRKVISLWIYVVLDAFSLKVVGWAAGEEKSEYLAIDAFKMAFKDHNFLPEEIIIDNDSLYKRQAFKRMRNRLNRFEVIVTDAEPNHPTWKSEIEGFFACFQKLHSSKKWYHGESIKSRNKSGNPAPEFVQKLFRKINSMLSIDEMIVAIGKMIMEYNGDSYNDKKKLSPSDYFKMYTSKRTIEYKFWMESILFWKTKARKRIKNDGRIDIEIATEKYTFQCTDKDVFWGYKNSDVRICYQPEDMSVVHIFDRLTSEFIGAIEPRLVLTRENKNEVLTQHRGILRTLTKEVRNQRQADRDMVFGTAHQQSIATESLADKILKRKVRRELKEQEVAAVKVHK